MKPAQLIDSNVKSPTVAEALKAVLASSDAFWAMFNDGGPTRLCFQVYGYTCTWLCGDDQRWAGPIDWAQALEAVSIKGKERLAHQEGETKRWWGVLCDAAENMGLLVPETAPHLAGWAKKKHEEWLAAERKSAVMREVLESFRHRADYLAVRASDGKACVAEAGMAAITAAVMFGRAPKESEGDAQ